MEHYVNLDLLELSVSKKTVYKWFKDCIKIVRGNHLVELDDFTDFVCTYRGGKYMEELCDVTKEEIDEMDYEVSVAIMLQRFFDRIVIVVTSCDNDELYEVMHGHTFTAKLMVI